MKKVKQMLNKSDGKHTIRGRESQNLKLNNGVPGGIRTPDPLLRGRPYHFCPLRLDLRSESETGYTPGSRSPKSLFEIFLHKTMITCKSCDVHVMWV